MAKRATLELEYPSKQVEFFGDFFVITYKSSVPYIDIFEKTGKPINRVDFSQVMSLNKLTLKCISKVKFPRLSWSNRKVEEFDLTKATVLRKTIVAGECLHEEKVRPFICKINLET